MADAALALIYLAWGAFWWRVRGGAWETLLRLPPGTTKARVATAFAFALPLAPWLGWSALALAPALYAGMACARWGHAFDIGRMGGRPLTDALWMVLWGGVLVAPVLALALALGWAWTPLVAFAPAFSLIYVAAWWLYERRVLPAIPSVLVGPIEWAELAVGAALAVALLLALC